MLEKCLKILQNRIACFQGLHLSFTQFIVSYCGIPLPEVVGHVALRLEKKRNVAQIDGLSI
jgi:hypothetical protein